MENGSSPATAVESMATSHIDEFARMASKRFAPLSMENGGAGNFRGHIRGRNLGDLDVFDVRANQHQVERSEPVASQTPKGSYMLHLQLTGVGVMRQDGREAVLSPGDMGFYDSDRAYSLSLDDEFRNAILVFPQRLLAIPAASASQLTATRLSGVEGLARMMVPFLTQLAGNLDQLSGHSSLRLAHNTVGLVSTMLYSELHSAAHRATELRPQENLLAQVRAYIEDNISDPTLNPAQIARANFISVRQLHASFSQEAATVSAWIRARRLELCRESLADPLSEVRPVSAVAASYGLVDAAHFSRLFKASYGESPRDFRQELRRAEGRA